MLCLTVPVREGSRETEEREERDHFIIRHQASLKLNMRHFPFTGTNSALCVGTVQHSPAWMEVSVQLIVALPLLEAHGLTMIEILFTVRGVVSVRGMLSFSRTDYSAGDSASSLQQPWMGFLCFWTGGHSHLCECVFLHKCEWLGASLCAHPCAHEFICAYRRAVCSFVNDEQ